MKNVKKFHLQIVNRLDMKVLPFRRLTLLKKMLHHLLKKKVHIENIRLGNEPGANPIGLLRM
jgi:hypothetical protein